MRRELAQLDRMVTHRRLRVVRQVWRSFSDENLFAGTWDDVSVVRPLSFAISRLSQTVQLSGAVVSDSVQAANSIVGTLPVEFRPQNLLTVPVAWVPTSGLESGATVFIGTTGNVFFGHAVDTDDEVYFDSVEFSIA